MVNFSAIVSMISRGRSPQSTPILSPPNSEQSLLSLLFLQMSPLTWLAIFAFLIVYLYLEFIDLFLLYQGWFNIGITIDELICMKYHMDPVQVKFVSYLMVNGM